MNNKGFFVIIIGLVLLQSYLIILLTKPKEKVTRLIDADFCPTTTKNYYISVRGNDTIILKMNYTITGILKYNKTSHSNGLNGRNGTVYLLYELDWDSLTVCDGVVFERNGERIGHYVIEKNETGVITQGLANKFNDGFTPKEELISGFVIVG